MDIPTDWTFKNEEVANNFDKHVREQLPWYDLATGMVAHLGRNYLPTGGVMYDIGCSTGNISSAMKSEILARGATITSIDNSEEMSKLFHGVGDFTLADATAFDYKPFDFACVFLCVMFMPVSVRKQWLYELSRKIKPGGCLVVFDKVEQGTGYLSAVMNRFALAGKVATGTSPSDIVAKELSLSGYQRPLMKWEMFVNATQVFQIGDFRGWVIIPET